MVEKRVSNIKRELSAVKQEAYDSGDDWIERRLEDDPSEEDLTFTNRK